MPPCPLTLEEFSDLSAQMLYDACPTPDQTPFFVIHMGEAFRLGLTWFESLQYVIERRRDVVH
ncbi:MAG TPA: hypothetical protein VM865_01080 [Acidobacteriaceae bacterium]|nr:hypothetical protein [Acidobacteriaceae bacterium]